MSSRLPCDPPHPRTTKKASASAAAVQLLLRHRGGRAAAKDESIEFFSALSGQTGAADRRGKATRTGELRAEEAGKHDYDWLLTPPATPLCMSPALSRLTRATSASHAKSNSPLSRTRSSVSSTTSSGRPPPVRTLSSASSSSIKAPSSASGRSTPTTSPRLRSTPAAATVCRPRPQDKTLGRRASSGSGAASQPKGSSSSSTAPSVPTSARTRAPTTGASSPKSTRTRVAPGRRGADAVARSRFAGQLGYDAMSTAPQAAENAVPPSMVKIRARPVSGTVKQSHGNGTAAVSSETQRRRSSPLPSPSPVTAAYRSASRGDSLAGKRLSRSGGGDGRKINDEKAAAPRRTTAGFASSAVSLMRRGLARTDSRKLTESAGAKHEGASAQQRSTPCVASRSRPGFAATVSDARGRRRSTAEKDRVTVAAAAAAPVAVPDAFPSTRYDAMLLREDPKNLTWLNGCGEDEDDDSDEDGGCGAGLVDGSLEPFHVTAAGTSGTAARF